MKPKNRIDELSLIMLAEEKDAEERIRLQNYLKEFEIPTNVYYPVPLHELPAFEGKSKQYNTAITEEACRTVLSLPIGPYITEEEIYFVCEKIKEFYTQMK